MLVRFMIRNELGGTREVAFNPEQLILIAEIYPSWEMEMAEGFKTIIEFRSNSYCVMESLDEVVARFEGAIKC